jgi:virulence factor Mce-like protein
VRRDGLIGGVGAFVVLAIVYVIFAKHVPFTHGYRVSAVFTTSNQLRTGNPVRVAGVDVGKVRSVSRGPGHTTVVHFDLKESARPLHRDATMKIRPRLFLEGSYYVDLRVGSPSAPELPDRGVIPLGQTAVPVQFNDILNALDRPARGSLKAVVARFAHGLGGGAARRFGAASRDFAPALRDSAAVAEASLGEAPHDLSTVIGSLSQITASLSRSDARLGDLIDGIDRTAAALAAEDDALGASVTASRDVLAHAPPTLRALDAALPPTTELARAVRPALRLAPEALRRTSALLDQADALTQPERLPAVTRSLQPIARRLPSSERRLQALFGWVTPVSDCVRARALPVLNTKLDDGALSTGRPVWQDLLHASVGLASAAASFDANGTFIRYLYSAGGDTLSVEEVPGGKLVAAGVPSNLRVRPRPLPAPKIPPYHPEATCRKQAPPNLAAPDIPIHTFDDGAASSPLGRWLRFLGRLL